MTKLFHNLLIVFTTLLLSSCGGISPLKDPSAIGQLVAMEIVYGIVVEVASADYPANVKSCASSHPTGQSVEICANLKNYNVVTANVAATTGKSFLKVHPVVSKSIEVKSDDIIKVKIGSPSNLIEIKSHGNVLAAVGREAAL